jgi:hypothetical protein
LQEAWAGRESAVFRLPPSRLALDSADVIALDHDGRAQQFRLTAIADAEARGIEAVRQDRAAYDLPPGAERPATLPRAVTFGPPEVILLDLPQLRDDVPAHQPLIAATAKPWPGALAVYRSAGTDGFELLTTVRRRANMGRLAADLWPGPTSRFDMGNVLILDLDSGQLDSVSDLALFGSANALAVETAPGRWEIVQAGHAELIAQGRYRLTRLLRGQRGTEQAMGDPTPAEARVVLLNEALTPLPIPEADLGIPFNWRIGPARHPVSSDTFTAVSFTPEGEGLRPFSPVHVTQPWRRPHVPGDLTICWTRRSRAIAADSWQGMEVLLGEEQESYEVRIMDGSVVKRTLTSTAPSVTYTAAQQIADWGAELAPGDSMTIRLCQLSARIGRGTPRTTTLYL